jgi:hypothetical protein
MGWEEYLTDDAVDDLLQRYAAASWWRWATW